MTLAHNFSTQISDLAKLKQIAAQFGFIQTRGPQKGEGSVRQLLEALIEGEAILLRTQGQITPMSAERQDMVLQQKLLAQGLISEIKPLVKRRLSPFNPVQVEGEPISQMILRERAMNHFFFDTSALVKRYVSEIGSQWVNTLISQATTRAYISRLAEAEVSAALTRRLSNTDATRVLHDFDQDVMTTYTPLEITSAVITDAVQLTRRHRLRGCDALQLATARQLAQLEPTLVFICSDKDLLTAAGAAGLKVDDPELHP